MKIDDYLNLLKELKMDGMERALASPKQFRVNSINTLLLNIKMLNNGPNPVWMSQNRYHNGDSIIAEKVFVEFEGKGPKILEQSISHSDMLKLLEFAETHGIRMAVLHSGNKSFHTYIHIKNEMDNPDNFTRRYEEIGRGLVVSLKLKSVDMKCCEPKRLHRVPLTNKKGQKSCIPIPVNMLSDIKSIIELAENPIVRLGTYTTKGSEISLNDLYNLVRSGKSDHAPDFLEIPGVQPNYHSSISMEKDSFVSYLKEIIVQRCVLNDLLTVHPEHETRVALMGLLNFMDYSIDEAQTLVDKIANYAQWDDKGNADDRRYYVDHAIRRKYKSYSCKKLCDKGLKCVGKECLLFGR